MTSQRRYIVFALLIAVHLVISIIIHHVNTYYGSVEFRECFFEGILVAQVSLLAIWVTLGSELWMHRILRVFFLITLYWLAMMVGTWMSSGYSGYWINSSSILGMGYLPDYAVFSMMVASVGFVVHCIPLWIARRIWGWQLTVIQASGSTSSGSRFQFSIRHLMLWTAWIAIVLGVSRLRVPLSRLPEVNWETVLHFLLEYLRPPVVYTTIVIPCLWAVFAKGSAVTRHFALGFLVGIVTTIEMVLIGESQFSYVFFLLLLLNFVLAATVAGSLWIARAAGIKLVRGGAAKLNEEQIASTAK